MIEIEGIRYAVRLTDNGREVYCEGKWIPAYQFVNILAEREEWGTLGELAKLGHNVIKGATI